MVSIVTVINSGVAVSVAIVSVAIVSAAIVSEAIVSEAIVSVAIVSVAMVSVAIVSTPARAGACEARAWHVWVHRPPAAACARTGVGTLGSGARGQG